MPSPKLTLMLMPTMDEEAMEDMEATEVTVMVGMDMDVNEEAPLLKLMLTMDMVAMEATVDMVVMEVMDMVVNID